MTQTTDTPDWLKAHHAQQPQGGTVRPNGSRGWSPGQSGNPQGRPRGSRNRKTIIEQEFEKGGSAIAAVVKEKALGGDMTACQLILQRLCPPLRPRAARVEFEFDPSKPLAEQAHQILVAVAAGKVDPETGQLLMNCISNFAGIKQVDDLQARIEALERHRH